MKVCILDPSLGTHSGIPNNNLGDLIVQDAVNREVTALFPGSSLTRFSTRQSLGLDQLREVSRCDRIFVGGTNLLSSHILKYRQWKISPFDAWYLNKAILLGVGWWQYQNAADLLTRLTLRGVLSKNAIHSVRDGYTATMLRAAGLPKAINTGCVTMWPFVDFDQESIPKTKGKNALVMLTDYMKEPEWDKRLIGLLNENYEHVYLWPQGIQDEEYVASLDVQVTILEHTFDAFRRFVSDEPSFDYIGTRLHGGIWCLLHRRRSLILEIDNRAAEIHKDTDLPTSRRNDFEFMARWIAGPTETRIKMNDVAIRQWKLQFSQQAPE